MLLIRDVDSILTLDARRRILERHSVLIGEGKILRIGDTATLDRDHLDTVRRAGKVIEGAGCMMLPAHVNTHVHTVEHLSLEVIRPSHRFDVTCQGTVPTTLVCAFESTSLEDAVRNAVSLGGDTDTLAAIAGAVGEAMHGLPEGLVRTARERYLSDAEDITTTFDALYDQAKQRMTPSTFDGVAVAPADQPLAAGRP